MLRVTASAVQDKRQKGKSQAALTKHLLAKGSDPLRVVPNSIPTQDSCAKDRAAELERMLTRCHREKLPWQSGLCQASLAWGYTCQAAERLVAVARFSANSHHLFSCVVAKRR